MGARLITNQEAIVLRDTLLERGQLSFPLGSIIGGFLCGTIYGIQRSSKPFKPRLRSRLVAKFSDGYASVLAFILWIGPENIKVWSEPKVIEGKLGKFHFCMKLKPNNALKCAPSGPDAASLRRLI